MRNRQDKTTPKTDARRARQDAVGVHHRDMSTQEITAQIDSRTTLVSMYEAQRARNQRTISDATSDMRTCDRMIDELNADVVTLRDLVKARKS